MGRDTDRRGVWIGIGCTVALHALLVVMAPKLGVLFPAASTDDADAAYSISGDTARPFEIEFAPAAPEPPAPDRFVEINPDAPVNEPDETRNFAAQSQQVAQPEPAPEDRGDTPAVRSDSEIEGVAIVQGSLVEPDVPTVAAPPTTPAGAASPDDARTAEPEDAARLEVNPLPGYETLVGESPDGPGSTVSREAGEADARVEGSPNGTPQGDAPRGGLVRIDPKNPMPRPRLAPEMVRPVQARPAPLIDNEFGTRNIGAVAFDAKWSSYGEYLKRFIDVVQVQWERLILNATSYPVSGTLVKVRFKMNALGEISEIVEVESNGGQSSKYTCVTAITERAPYGEWSDDMVSVLGQEQEITIVFHYQ